MTPRLADEAVFCRNPKHEFFGLYLHYCEECSIDESRHVLDEMYKYLMRDSIRNGGEK